MVRRRLIRKRKRPHLREYRQGGTLSNGHHKPHAYKQSGEKLSLFQDTSQVKAVNEPPVEVKQVHRKPAIDYLLLAIKVAKVYSRKTSSEHVNKVAKGLFSFDTTSHLDKKMPDIVSQEIYDWILTLSKQHISEEEKLRLVREFVVSLAPESSNVIIQLLRYCRSSQI
jgi:hypothetical protein